MDILQEKELHLRTPVEEITEIPDVPETLEDDSDEENGPDPVEADVDAGPRLPIEQALSDYDNE